jgi:predicted ArsR family transcriptional regulator
MHVLATTVTFSIMNRDSGQTHVAALADAATASSGGLPLNESRGPSALTSGPSGTSITSFEHGTDADIIGRRVRAVNPLATPSPHPGNASPTLRREVLYALRTGGPASPDQIAQRVGASRTGVLQQLRTLELAGLVSRSLSRHGVGRPRHVYDLTPGAQELFPANYGALAQSVLTAIRSVGGEALINDVFEARRELIRVRIARRLEERLSPGASLWERVREVAAYQDENGYLGRATLNEDGTIRLYEHNCAIYGVAGTYQTACIAELQLFAEVLGATVTRECHIASGGRSCTYRVEPSKL